MLFNSLSGNNNASGVVIDDKSRQWFGASVHSSGPDGIIVVSWIIEKNLHFELKNLFYVMHWNKEKVCNAMY